MTARVTFLAIAGFWLTMNALLWRAEYGSHAGEIPVPVALVWKKILTAPDASSLSVYQKSDRVGYCEISTSIGQEMAGLDAGKLPPENLVKRAGYQLHLAGNVSFGDFTNRMKFDGLLRFSNARRWQELTLKITVRPTVVEIHSLATNQTVHVKITGDGATVERDLTLADLQSPAALLHVFAGDLADPLLGTRDLPDFKTLGGDQPPAWNASRTRVKIGAEAVPIYRLTATVFGRDVIMDCSTLGEVLRVDLPGNISARIDEWARP